MADASIPASYFETLYAADPDPWRFATSDYERDKYAATLAALPEPRFTNALEVGCSIGVFTAQLAPRCDALRALDVVEPVLASARVRCAGLPVTFSRARVPADWPDGAYDLILFSEVLYYLDRDDLARVAARTCRSLLPGATVVLVHFTDPTNYPLTGDAAAEGFMALTAATLRRVHAARAARYRLDVLRA